MNKVFTCVTMMPCHTCCAEDHAFRRRTTNGTRTDLEPENIYVSYEEISPRMKRIKIEHKAQCGQKLQPHAYPIREMVVTEMTDNEQALKFKDTIEKEFGVEVIGYAVHKDEGHYDLDSSEWIPNYHAHFFVDLTIWSHELKKAPKRIHGKCVRDPETNAVIMIDKDYYAKIRHFSKGDLSKIQDIAAEIIGLERGKQSTRKHIDSQEFRAEELKKDIAVLEERKEGLEDQIKKTEEILVHCGDKIKEHTEKTRVELNRFIEKHYIELIPDFPVIPDLLAETVLYGVDSLRILNNHPKNNDLTSKIDYYVKMVEQSTSTSMRIINVAKLAYKSFVRKRQIISLIRSAKRWFCNILNKPADDEARKLRSKVEELGKTINEAMSKQDALKGENEKLKSDIQIVNNQNDTIKEENKGLKNRLIALNNDKSETLKHLLSLNLNHTTLEHLDSLNIPRLLGDKAWNQLKESVNQRTNPNKSRGLHL